MGVLRVSESEFVRKLIAASTEYIASGTDCFIHVERDTGEISWSSYEEGEMFSKHAFHLSCAEMTGQVWEDGEVSIRSEDMETMMRAKPDVFIEPVKRELQCKVWDAQCQFEWLP